VADDLPVRAGLVIPGTELDERFSTSGGPGGQHANTSHTRVELRFDIATSPTLSDHQRTRLLERFGDELRVVADDERSQRRNRDLARERMAARLSSALEPVRHRRPTRPTLGSKRRRLEEKRRRGSTKRDRRPPGRDD